MVEHHKIRQSVAIPIHSKRCGAPLGKERLPHWPQPPVGESRLSPFPLDLDGLRGCKFGLASCPDIFKPNHFAPNGIDDEIQSAVTIPISHTQRCVPPFRFSRTLDASV